MKPESAVRPHRLVLAWLVVAFPFAAVPPGGEAAVVVERILAGSAPEASGLRVGDVLERWRRGEGGEGQGGSFDSPFGFVEAWVERGPRGGVVLLGRRGDAPLSIPMPHPDGRMSVRPEFTALDRSDWEESVSAAADADRLRASGAGTSARSALATAIARLLEIEERAEARGNREIALWCRLRAGRLSAGDRQAAERILEEAAGGARRLGRPAVLAQVLAEVSRLRLLADDTAGAEHADRCRVECLEEAGGRTLLLAEALFALGRSRDAMGDLAGAEEVHRRALAIRTAESPGSLGVASSLNEVGLCAFGRGNLPAAEELHRAALALRERLAPEGMEVARSLNNLGLVFMAREDAEAAEPLFLRSLAIKERLAPGSATVAATLNNLGNASQSRGDLLGARDFYRRALAIDSALGPASPEVASRLINLSNVDVATGELADAEELLRRALAIEEKVAPGSLRVAGVLLNLAGIAIARRDADAARPVLHRTLEIRRRLAPGSLDLAETSLALGGIEAAEGNGDEAAALIDGALAIQEELAPESLLVARSRAALARVAAASGDLAGAEERHLSALRIRERAAPGSIGVATSLVSVGGIASLLGDPVRAAASLDRAIAILSAKAPDSESAAEGFAARAEVRRALGDSGGAEEDACEAIRALEAQRGRLGGSEDVRSGFAARHAGLYRLAAELRLEAGDPAGAFAVLERFRARGLAAMLAERALDFGRDIPPELERERRIADTESDRLLAKRRDAADPAAPGIEEAIREIRRRQAEIDRRIRESSPRLASLRTPEPLGLDGVRAALDPGTLLLAYSVGPEATRLFAVDRRGIEVHSIPEGEERLRRDIRRFRQVIASTGAVAEAVRRATALGSSLLAPAAAAIGAAERILICPDGPLHFLPFAALRVPGSERWLVEEKPVHVVASATVYAELLARRKPEGAPSGPLVAFGDPSYPAGTGYRGRPFEPLPASRKEVEALAAPAGATEIRRHLGAEATEERARALPAEAKYVHFACHGLVDEAMPLDSALALSLGKGPEAGAENGLLQAFEVFEHVRLDAELVTLSACETAGGREIAGEGLVGLVRAFQYAGARSVLASLWSVADESTAELMKRFYAGLAAGFPKDEALRRAQVALIRGEADGGGAAAAPYHWAGFELIGDWR